MFKWTKGRQSANYEKLTLLESKRFKFDLHIIKVPALENIPEHRDLAPEGYKHHRLNAHFGPGEIWIKLGDGWIKGTRKFYYFRPDIQTHRMLWEYKPTYILSFGWLTKTNRFYGEVVPV